MNKLVVLLVLVGFLGSCSFREPPSRPDDAVVTGVHYIGLTVSDIDRAAKLYTESANVVEVDKTQFNAQPVIDELVGRAGVKASTRLLRSVNAQIRLMEFENPSEAAKAADPVKVYGPGNAHLAFQVAKSTNVYQRFLDAGAVYIGHPDIQVNPRTHVGYAYVYDFDQSVIEIEEVDVEALDLPEPPKNEYRIRQISLATPDVDRSAEFYAHLLQTSNGRRAGPMSGEGIDNVSGEKGAELEFAWFQIRNLELEIIEYVSHDTKLPDTPRPLDAPGFNMIVFDVADMAAARQLFVEAGGTIVLENKELDGSDVMFGRDPDGNLLGFQQFANESVLSAQNFANNGIE